jgi:hypothetical protein
MKLCSIKENAITVRLEAEKKYFVPMLEGAK